MSIQYFEIEKGLAVDGQVTLLVGSGAPGSTTDTNDALKGTSYQDFLNGKLYTKILDGSGTDKWQPQATEAYVNSVVSANISSREPVSVHDSSATTLVALKADLDADGLIQGVSVSVGMRILASAISPGNKNVYIVGGVTTNWTLTEDANTATSGDTVYVISGTDTTKKFTFNGTNWVWDDQSITDELGFVRSFIGKAPGNDLPIYSSVTQITQNTPLETAIGALDATLGTDPLSGEVVLPTATVNANIKALDDFITLNHHKSTANNVTTQVVLDSVDKNTVDGVKWIVFASDVSTGTRKRGREIFAIHDGTTPADTQYAKISLGANITGLTYSVVITGANLELRVSSTLAANVESRRVGTV